MCVLQLGFHQTQDISSDVFQWQKVLNAKSYALMISITSVHQHQMIPVPAVLQMTMDVRSLLSVLSMHQPMLLDSSTLHVHIRRVCVEDRQPRLLQMMDQNRNSSQLVNCLHKVACVVSNWLSQKDPLRKISLLLKSMKLVQWHFTALQQMNIRLKPMKQLT